MALQHVLVVFVCMSCNVRLIRAAIPSTAYIAFISEANNAQERQAVQSAIQEINSDPSLLSSTTLKLVPAVNDSTGFNYAVNLTTYDALAMVMDSKPTASHELLSALLSIPLVTTSSSHGNASTTKRGLSLAISRDDVIRAMADIVENYKLTNVLVLFDVRWSDQIDRFRALLSTDIEVDNLAMVLDYKGALFDNTMTKLAQLNNKPIEAIVLFCDAQYVNIIMEQVHSSGSRVVERSHTWILADMIPSFKMKVERHQAVIGFTPSIMNNRHTQRLLTDLAANQTDIKNSSYLVYDSVLTFAHALNDVITGNRWITYSHTHNVEKSKNGMNILSSMKTVKISGTTGDVHFNTAGVRQGMVLDVMNLRQDVFVKIGDWSVSRPKRLLAGDLEQNVVQLETIPISRLNRKLKVVIVEDPPFIIKEVDEATKKVTYSGYSIDMITEIAKLLSFKFQIVEAPDGNYGGKQADGTYNGIVGEIYKKKGDLSVSPLTINSGRVQYLTFSKPFMQFTMDLLAKEPAPAGTDILAFMMPYSIPVWLMTLACLAFMTCMLTLVNHYSPFGHRLGNNDGTGDEFNMFNSLWFSLASMLQQGGDNTPKCLSGRVLVGCFWFCVLIWVSTYTANLAAFFQYRSNGNIVDTIQEVVDGDYDLHIMADTALEELFKVADYHVYQTLYQRMVSRKLFVNSSSAGYDKVRANRKSIYMDENPFSQYYIARKPCDLVSAKGFMGAQGYGIAMPKDYPYANNISVAILKLQEIGTLEDMRRKWWDYKSQCRKKSNTNLTERLALPNMAGVYIVLGFGCFIGMLTVLGELWWSKKGEQIKKKLKQLIPRLSTS